MTRTNFRRLMTIDSTTLLEQLSQRQFVRPHAALGDVVNQIIAAMGVDASVGESATHWLKFNPAMSVGRLRRTELSQLAQTIRRLSRQAATGRSTPKRASQNIITNETSQRLAST